MKFRVTWKPDARRNLARLYLAATDKRAFTKAADRIDAVLTRNPIGNGMQIKGNRRAWMSAPLVVTYDVLLDDYLVRVVSVKSINPEG